MDGKGDLGGGDKVRGRTPESRSRDVGVEDMEGVAAEQRALLLRRQQWELSVGEQMSCYTMLVGKGNLGIGDKARRIRLRLVSKLGGHRCRLMDA